MKLLHYVYQFFKNVLFTLYQPLLTSILIILLLIISNKYLHNYCCPNKNNKNDENNKKIDDKKNKLKPDPWNAICKVTMRGGYCSGTIVGPRREDGRWNIVSASHCFMNVGESVLITTRNGITFNARVAALNRKCDAAILVSEPIEVVPYALLAEENPIVNQKVYHGGYGVHIPGNREEGVVVNEEDSNGQICYYISVSKGDSGGGIMLDENDNLLSPVCCTTHLNTKGYVWGASPRMLNKMIKNPTQYAGNDSIKPIELPIRK